MREGKRKGEHTRNTQKGTPRAICPTGNPKGGHESDERETRVTQSAANMADTKGKRSPRLGRSGQPQRDEIARGSANIAGSKGARESIEFPLSKGIEDDL